MTITDAEDATGSEAVRPRPKVPDRLPTPTVVWGLRIVMGTIIAVLALWLPYSYLDSNVNTLLAQALYLAIAAQGLNLLTGFNGQVSIGHAAFFGVGAFTSAILMIDHGWSYEATIPVGALLAALLGVVVGFPALRVKGLYLALVTLGLALLFPAAIAKYVTGSGGIALLNPPGRELGSTIDTLANDQYAYYLCLGVAVLMFVLAWSLVHSRIGRAMVAIRDQETAASAVGVHVARVKVLTFSVSAAFAGVAGSLSLLVDKVADATQPGAYFQRSIEFLVAMVIGGAATILGPAVGAFLIIALRRNTEDLIEGKEILAPAIFGASLILIVYVLPEGVVGGLRRLVALLTRRSVPPSTLTAQTTTSDPTS